ncbi:RICIN domain-containing protein [Streptomyces chartreusis]|uniref:RICIN domain-containing protein n=1 Tax=Streptomyces chartreusis TaxID=1969 RepID=UPI0036BEA49F
MRTTRTRSVLAVALAGALLAVASPAIAHADESPNSDTRQPRAEFYKITNLKSGKVMQAASSANGAKVVQQPRQVGAGLQDWFLVLDGNFVSFENFQSGLNLGIDGASTANGAAAITANGSGDANQDWLRDEDTYAGEYFALRNRKSGRCLGVSGASTANGAQVAQFACDSSDTNQGWKLSN